MVTVYATREDYYRYGNKTLEEIEVEKYLELASIDINRATLTKIEKRRFSNLTEQQKNLIVRATCLQAEHIKNKEEEMMDDIASYSIGGDLSVSVIQSRETSSILKISKIAFSYLKRAGLTSRIIC